MIELERVSFTYPGAAAPALREVTLHLPAGSLTLVSGPSGSGKSTLLRCLNGLVPHFSGGVWRGRVRVAGRDPVAEGPARMSRVVGFVQQDPESQFITGVVEDELAFGLENAGWSRAALTARVEELLSRLGLAHLRGRRVETLSGGEQQRVIVGAVLAPRPPVLVLDEPTSQLDPDGAREVLALLAALKAEGLTLVVAEHRLERVLPFADFWVEVEAGRATCRAVPAAGRGGGAHPIASSAAVRMSTARVPAASEPVEEAASTSSASGGTASTSSAFGGTAPEPVEGVSELVEEAASTGSASEGSASTSSASGGTAPEPVEEAAPELAEGAVVLAAEDLTVRYGTHTVFEGLSLTLRAGELVALIGPNGAGKTTLLRALMGLVKPVTGRVWLEGAPRGEDVAQVARRMALLPQDPNALLFAESVMDELRITLRNHRLLAQPPVAPEALLEELGLREVAHVYPRELSVGQRQRVALAALLVTRPRVLLLDEPTRGLDARAKEALLALLQRFRAQGMAVLVATHDIPRFTDAADRVVALNVASSPER